MPVHIVIGIALHVTTVASVNIQQKVMRTWIDLRTYARAEMFQLISQVYVNTKHVLVHIIMISYVVLVLP